MPLGSLLRVAGSQELQGVPWTHLMFRYSLLAEFNTALKALLKSNDAKVCSSCGGALVQWSVCSSAHTLGALFCGAVPAAGLGEGVDSGHRALHLAYHQGRVAQGDASIDTKGMLCAVRVRVRVCRPPAPHLIHAYERTPLTCATCYCVWLRHHQSGCKNIRLSNFSATQSVDSGHNTISNSSCMFSQLFSLARNWSADVFQTANSDNRTFEVTRSEGAGRGSCGCHQAAVTTPH